MTDRKTLRRHREKQEFGAGDKQNNPFSEQEKHGEEAQRRGPRTEQESKGGSVQLPTPTKKKTV